jgi:hypothetical protein
MSELAQDRCAPRIALSVAEAAVACSLSARALYIAIKCGALRCHKHGTRSLVTPRDLAAFVEMLPLAPVGSHDGLSEAERTAVASVPIQPRALRLVEE